MPKEFAYDYRYVCSCGAELETDDANTFNGFVTAHVSHTNPETEALTLLTRLVTAVETIAAHSNGRYGGAE